MSEVLCATGLQKTYADGQLSLKVLQDVNLSVRSGERICIVGKSGSGKSTLLHLLAGLLDGDAGEVRVMDQLLSDQPSNARALLRNRHMGFVYQFHHLLPEFDVVENVAMPLILRGQSKRQAAAQAREVLEPIGLMERSGHLPHQLSGGEKLRVAVARAMVTEPNIVLADEPTGNLDRDNATAVLELMQSMAERSHTAFVVVSHDLEVVNYMPRCFQLEDGTLREA